MTQNTTTREITVLDEPCPWDCDGAVGDCYPENCDRRCPDCARERALDDDFYAWADR
jgi:hypothetical protein